MEGAVIRALIPHSAHTVLRKLQTARRVLKPSARPYGADRISLIEASQIFAQHRTAMQVTARKVEKG